MTGFPFLNIILEIGDVNTPGSRLGHHDAWFAGDRRSGFHDPVTRRTNDKLYSHCRLPISDNT